MTDIISRQEWNAREPKHTTRMNPANVTHTFIHYTAGPVSQSVRSIQDYHMDTKGWSDIAYNYLVDQNGDIYVGRGWFVVGGHTSGWNSKSHAICWIGGPEDTPTDAALKSINYLIQDVETRLGRKTIVAPHSSVVSTSCPGDYLRAWIKNGRPTSATPAPEAPESPEDEPMADPYQLWQIKGAAPTIDPLAVWLVSDDRFVYRLVGSERELGVLRSTLVREGLYATEGDVPLYIADPVKTPADFEAFSYMVDVTK